MSTTLEAIYENGVFRPLKPVALRENQRVTVTIAEAVPPEVGVEGSQEVSSRPPDRPPSQEDAELEARPWRGAFCPEQPQAPLFTSELEIRTADLPAWQP